MSGQFIGRLVLIKTVDFQVEGTVLAIENGRVILENVYRQGTGERLSKMIVEGTAITDIKMLEESGSARSNNTVNAKSREHTPAQTARASPDSSKRAEYELAAQTLRQNGGIKEHTTLRPKEVLPDIAHKKPLNRRERRNRDSNNGGSSKSASEEPEKPSSTGPSSSSLTQSTGLNYDKDTTSNNLRVSNQFITPPIKAQSSVVAQGSPAGHHGKRTPSCENVANVSTSIGIGASVNSSSGPIPVATPLQLSKIINQQINAGYSSNAMAERAAQGIVEIISSVKGPVVFLVGVHEPGLWAIAAARRLASAGIQVAVVSPSSTAVKGLEAQSKLFVAAGGQFVTTQKALAAALKGATPQLVVDALQGYEVPLVDQLDAEEAQAAAWLVQWSACAHKRLSLSTAIIPNSSIIAFGFPLGPCDYLVDIGISTATISSLKLRRFINRPFGLSSFIPVARE